MAKAKEMTCPKCGQTVVMKRERIRVPLDEMPHVVVDGVEHLTCPRCGVGMEAWPRSGPLLDALTSAVASKPRRLTPGEFRWLRKRVDPRAKEFAERFGVTPEIVSKWENGKTPITAQADRLLRAMAILRRGLEPSFDPDVFVRLDDADTAPLRLGAVLGVRGWKLIGADAPKATRSRSRAA